MHKLAVILVNYNGQSDTIDCIKSIKSSTYPIKIFVVDNASIKDETILMEQMFPDVSFIRSNKNLGFAGGNNLAIKTALNEGYDFVALLNNDTIVLKDTFENLITSADESTVVSPIMNYFIYPDEIWFAGGFINRWTGNAKHIRKLPSSTTLDISFATGCCFVAHRKIWEKVGLLDESYFMYNEDEDFCVRLLQNNIRIKVIVNSLIYHKVGKSCGGEISKFQIYYMTRNRIRVIKKFHRFFYWTAFPFTLITRLLWAFKFFLSRKTEWRVFIKGIYDGIRNVEGRANL